MNDIKTLVAFHLKYNQKRYGLEHINDHERLELILQHRKGDVNAIQSCITARLQTGLFRCSCGVCQAYMLQKLYESITNPEERTSRAYTILRTGQHTGKTFKQIYDTDKKYCIWCIQQAALDPSSEYSEFAEWVSAALSGGKWPGWAIGDLFVSAQVARRLQKGPSQRRRKIFAFGKGSGGGRSLAGSWVVREIFVFSVGVVDFKGIWRMGWPVCILVGGWKDGI